MGGKFFKKKQTGAPKKFFFPTIKNVKNFSFLFFSSKNNKFNFKPKFSSCFYPAFQISKNLLGDPFDPFVKGASFFRKNFFFFQKKSLFLFPFSFFPLLFFPVCWFVWEKRDWIFIFGFFLQALKKHWSKRFGFGEKKEFKPQTDTVFKVFLFRDWKNLTFLNFWLGRFYVFFCLIAPKKKNAPLKLIFCLPGPGIW